MKYIPSPHFLGARVSILESRLGDYSYVIHDSQIAYAQIGKFCSIASFVRINPGNHPLNRVAMHHFTYRSGQFSLGDDEQELFEWRRSHRVRFGNDVWVGHSATILPGITIGTGAAIGAGSVVTKDVPPFTVTAGVPAVPIRERFAKNIQDALPGIGWWDWPRDTLHEGFE